MEDERNGAKRAYEPPRVLRLDAAGEAAGVCLPSGSGDVICSTGASARFGCEDGASAVDICRTGAGY